MDKIGKVLSSFLLLMIRLYQITISPLLGPKCRFYPTCSNYAQIALKEHGFLKGFALAFLRILKCHPLSQGGFDPVPQKKVITK